MWYGLYSMSLCVTRVIQSVSSVIPQGMTGCDDSSLSVCMYVAGHQMAIAQLEKRVHDLERGTGSYLPTELPTYLPTYLEHH